MGKIVWLASYPKSGNTWVRVFLHNYITDARVPHSINQLTNFSVSESNSVFFNKYDARPASQFTTRDVQALRPRVHQGFTQLHDDLVFVKTHNAALSVHGIPLCTPRHTAGAIYIVRDPRDVAVSYAAYTRLTLDRTIAFMAKSGAANRGTEAQVFEFLGSWSAHVESWLAASNVLVVRYEDLLNAPHVAFGKVIGFLGDGVEDTERLRRAIDFSGFGTLAAEEEADGYAAGGGNGRFFRNGKAGQWYDRLSAAQIALIEMDHGGIMRRFNYLF